MIGIRECGLSDSCDGTKQNPFENILEALYHLNVTKKFECPHYIILFMETEDILTEEDFEKFLRKHNYGSAEELKFNLLKEGLENITLKPLETTISRLVYMNTQKLLIMSPPNINLINLEVNLIFDQNSVNDEKSSYLFTFVSSSSKFEMVNCSYLTNANYGLLRNLDDSRIKVIIIDCVLDFKVSNPKAERNFFYILSPDFYESSFFILNSLIMYTDENSLDFSGNGLITFEGGCDFLAVNMSIFCVQSGNEINFSLFNFTSSSKIKYEHLFVKFLNSSYSSTPLKIMNLGNNNTLEIVSFVLEDDFSQLGSHKVLVFADQDNKIFVSDFLFNTSMDNQLTRTSDSILTIFNVEFYNYLELNTAYMNFNLENMHKMIFINANENNTVVLRNCNIKCVQSPLTLLKAYDHNSVNIQMLHLSDFLPPSADMTALSLISLIQSNILKLSESSFKKIKKWRIIVCDQYNSISFLNISIDTVILNDNHGMIAYFNKEGNRITISESNISGIKSNVEFGNLYFCKFKFDIRCPGGFIRSNGGLYLKIFKLTLIDTISLSGVNNFLYIFFLMTL